MIAKCQVETQGFVRLAPKVRQPSGQPTYITHTGTLEEILDTYRTIISHLEVAAEQLVETYNLTAGDVLTAELTVDGSHFDAVVSCTHYDEGDGE